MYCTKRYISIISRTACGIFDPFDALDSWTRDAQKRWEDIFPCDADFCAKTKLEKFVHGTVRCISRQDGSCVETDYIFRFLRSPNLFLDVMIKSTVLMEAEIWHVDLRITQSL